MTKYETLKADIDKLAEGVTDVEALKTLGAINTQIDLIEKEENELIGKHRELAKDYKDAIMHADLKPLHTQEESGGNNATPKSIESIIDGIVNKKGN